jgi:hypothetical protein
MYAMFGPRIRRNEDQLEVVDPSLILEELREIQKGLRSLQDSTFRLSRRTRQKERLYEDIRHTRSFQ